LNAGGVAALNAIRLKLRHLKVASLLARVLSSPLKRAQLQPLGSSDI
jgi:hypothetical protein